MKKYYKRISATYLIQNPEIDNDYEVGEKLNSKLEVWLNTHDIVDYRITNADTVFVPEHPIVASEPYLLASLHIEYTI